MVFHEGAKKVLDVADHHLPRSAGKSNRIYFRFCRRTFRIHFILIAGDQRHRSSALKLAQIERNLREGEARLPVAEQLRLNLRRLIESKNITELAGASIDIVDNTVTLRLLDTYDTYRSLV